MRRPVCWLVVGLLLIGAGAATWHFANRERADLPPGLIEAVRSADRVTLYEGLPHQDYEASLLASERATHPVLELGGFPFYERPVSWRADDTEQLATWLTDPLGITTRHAGWGSCGSFHPDYALVWDGPAGRAVALVCLTCGEVRLVGTADPAGTLYRLGRRRDEVRNVLGEYREQRPPFYRIWENAIR